MKKIIVILLTMALVFSFVGCTEPDTDSSPEPDDNTSIDSTEKVYKIGLSIPVSAAPYWAGVDYGVQEAVKEINKTAGEIVLEYQLLDPGTFELETQLKNIEDAISLGFDGMVIAPVDADGTVPAIKQAYDAGVPIFTVDVSANTDVVLAGFGTYNYGAGCTYADQFAELIKEKNGDYKGNVAMNLGFPNISSHIARVQGFKDTLEENYPDIKIIYEHFSNGHEEDVTVIENALAMHGKEIDGIFTTGDAAANSACKAVDNANLFKPVGDPEHIVIVGFDGEMSGLQNIRNNRQDATVAQNPIGMGYMSTRALYDYLVTGELPEVDDNNSIEVPHLAINIRNIDSPEAEGFLWSEIVEGN